MSKDLKPRHISTESEHLSDPKVCYRTYAYLLAISKLDMDTKIRYVEKDDVPKLSKVITSYTSLRRKLRYLTSVGLIYEDKGTIYIKEDFKYYKAHPNTIKFLSDTVLEDVIKLYVYLGGWFNWSEGKNIKDRIYDIDNMSEDLGLKPNRYSRQVIRNRLSILKTLGLIDYDFVDSTRLISKEDYKNTTKITLIKVNKTSKQTTTNINKY